MDMSHSIRERKLSFVLVQPYFGYLLKHDHALLPVEHQQDFLGINLGRHTPHMHVAPTMPNCLRYIFRSKKPHPSLPPRTQTPTPQPPLKSSKYGIFRLLYV